MDLNTTGIIYHSATNAYHHISQTIKKAFDLKVQSKYVFKCLVKENAVLTYQFQMAFRSSKIETSQTVWLSKEVVQILNNEPQRRH